MGSSSGAVVGRDMDPVPSDMSQPELSGKLHQSKQSNEHEVEKHTQRKDVTFLKTLLPLGSPRVTPGRHLNNKTLFTMFAKVLVKICQL